MTIRQESALPLKPLAPTMPGRLVFRELSAPREVVALLRLRHRAYFEEHAYGAPKPFGIDLSAHDTHARLFGVFRARELVGGLRLVFRHEQALAPVVRTLRALVQSEQPEASTLSLPSEEAFDLGAALGARARLVDLEVGRLFVARPGVGPTALREIMIATLAVILLARCRFYMYSCARELAGRYARVSRPRWTLPEPVADGIRSDGFPFPKPTVAAVAAAEDSPYLEQALAYAPAFERDDAVELTSCATQLRSRSGSEP